MRQTRILFVTLLLICAFAIQAACAQNVPEVELTASPSAFNPGTGGTGISYSLSNFYDADVTIQAMNAAGVAVRTLSAGTVDNGQYSLTWNGRDNNGIIVPQGTYTVKASASTGIATPWQFLMQWSVPAVVTGNPGQFYYPYYVAVDANGDIYITDDYHHCVQKLDRNGALLQKWGTYGAGNGQFRYPAGIAVDGEGFVYVADTGNNRVQKFDSSGRFIAKWGNVGSGNGQFRSPYGVAVDGSGSVYVTDAGNYRIQCFSKDGIFKSVWGTYGTGNGQFLSPSCLAVTPDGQVYVTDSRAMKVQVFTNTGQYLRQWGSSGTGNGQFNTPYGITVDNCGNVFVADGRNNRVQIFDPYGHYLGSWGQAGTGSGQFKIPVGVAVTGAGSLIVVDCQNHRVQQLSPDMAAKTVTYTAQASVKVDSTVPSITIAAPVNGATYKLNQKVVASWSASDALSGIKSASGTVASGTYIDTSKAGTFSFIVQATDNAGNAGSLSYQYTVSGSETTPGTTATIRFTNASGSGPLFNVELARTSAEINRGLMYRTSLAENAGMLFIFSGDRYHYFWMANTYIPLDMVYISSSNTVVGIYPNAVPLSTVKIPCPAPCHYVLEINAGMCSKKGIRVGDKVIITGV